MIGRGSGGVIVLIHFCWIILFVIEEISMVAEKAILVGDMPGAAKSCIKNLPVNVPFSAVITPVTRRLEKFGKEGCPDGSLAFAPATFHRKVIPSDLLGIISSE